MTIVPDLQQNLNALVMTIYMDGSYNIQSVHDDHIEANCVVDYLTSIPLVNLIDEINKVTAS